MSELAVAETIIKQLGGAGRLSAMIGVRQFVGSENSVQFSFKGWKKANKCRIVLDPDDTYTLEFWRINMITGSELVESLDGVYADMLREMFTYTTGLDLSL